MAKHALHDAALSYLRCADIPLSLAEISLKLNNEVPQRTLRRWLFRWVAEGTVQRSGRGRASRYEVVEQAAHVRAADTFSFSFLKGLDDDVKTSVLKQIRDLWTHTSTAIEGNTLTLGDTHFILEEGLTISGKPIKDHQEVVGHGKAIEILYRCLYKPLSIDIVFDLHNAIQTENVLDIYKPNGAWKVEPKGSYAVGPDGNQVFIEYAMPVLVATFMVELIHTLNAIDVAEVTMSNAPGHYAKIHMGVVHIHPFWDGNGRIARLLANIPLLKAGLPPIVIPQQTRRAYIQTLANYQIAIGQLNKKTGVWPDSSRLKEFSNFCASCYDPTREIVANAFAIQKTRP